MCSINISINIGLVEILVWIITVSCSIAAPVINCGSGWTYGKHLSGTGCLRTLSRNYDLKTCLLNGHHITLITVPWDNVKRRDMYCVKDENLPYEIQNKPVDTRKTDNDNSDLKININDIVDDAVEGQPKAMGCCVDGIQPSG